MNNNAITNVAAPVNPGDAANKSYVDNSTNTAVNGTINTIPKFTAAHVLGNSALSDNAGTLSYTGNTIQQPTGGQSLGIVTAPFGGGSSGAITIKTGDIAGSGNPGAVNIIGGNSNGFGGAATAGSVNIAGGTSNNGNGGNVTIAGGGPGFGGLSGGGSVFISGGAAPAGNGGVTISTTNTNIAINPGVSNQITSNGGISIAGTSLIGNVGTTSVGIGGTGASTVNVNPSGTGTTTIGSGANNLQVNSTTGINNTIANPTVIGMNNAAATVAITGGTTWSVTAGGAATFATVAGNGAALTNVNAVKINGNTVPANAVGQLTNDGAGNLSWATAGSAVQFTRVAVTAPTTYNAATTDNFIGVNTTAAGNTIINLPTAAAAGSGHTIIIKDEALKVDAAHTVTINATGGNTLEDPATETFGGSAVMNGTFSPGVCFGYYSDGTSKWIIWTLNP